MVTYSLFKPALLVLGPASRCNKLSAGSVGSSAFLLPLLTARLGDAEGAFEVERDGYRIECVREGERGQL